MGFTELKRGYELMVLQDELASAEYILDEELWEYHTELAQHLQDHIGVLRAKIELLKSA